MVGHVDEKYKVAFVGARKIFHDGHRERPPFLRVACAANDRANGTAMHLSGVRKLFVISLDPIW